MLRRVTKTSFLLCNARLQPPFCIQAHLRRRDANQQALDKTLVTLAVPRSLGDTHRDDLHKENSYETNRFRS